MWSWWVVTGCDLFDDPDPTAWGKLPPVKLADDRTHEYICFALIPSVFSGSEPPDGWDADDHQAPNRVMCHILTPQEFVHQDRLSDNDQANEVLRLFVKAVCDGHTAADSDFRRRNVALLAGTAEHFRAGKHIVD